MIQPHELKLNLPMVLSNGITSTTTKVWEVLVASKNGDLQKLRQLVNECPALCYAQYNYTPPIHFAVREGHIALVQYLLDLGAHDPEYKIYPFQESLQTIARDRGHIAIAEMLDAYAANHSSQKFSGDNGEILYQRTTEQKAFEHWVDKEDVAKTENILQLHPEFAKDETYFWGEGILAFAAKENNHAMMDLLTSYGATVPAVLKWAQFYYFERYDGAAYIMEKGMNPNIMSWHHVTLLHDMAQKGQIPKAALLLQYGADINAIDEEYQSTPLGMASRWGQVDMVAYLLEQGANPNTAGAAWATPLVWAQQKQHAVIEKMLLQAGAK
ncbi:MAG TPA: ankyrin repeat domain-containing protein [Phnomibacter sp.]|nr:ankyrin repeat domain-containing protein [Phnomibacter sp.]